MRKELTGKIKANNDFLYYMMLAVSALLAAFAVILQPDMSRCGGISIAKKAADLARLKDIPVIPHAFKTGILMSASLQFIATVKNSFILEYCSQETVLSKNLIHHHFSLDEKGLVHIPDAPGLGIEVDHDMLEHYTVTM